MSFPFHVLLLVPLQYLLFKKKLALAFSDRALKYWWKPIAVLLKPNHYFPYQWVKSEEETQTLVVTVLQGIAAGSLLFVGFLEVR